MERRIVRQPRRHQDLRTFQGGNAQFLQRLAVQNCRILPGRLNGLLGYQLPVFLPQHPHSRGHQGECLRGVRPQHGGIVRRPCAQGQCLSQGGVRVLGMPGVENQPVGNAFVG